ncbi:MAG: beta-ketoacyl synthase chain length factor [Rhodanobacteraceae bacterium]
MTTLSVVVEGVGIWAPGLKGWPRAAAVLRGTACVDDAPERPRGTVLAQAERRRAPHSVLMACDVAAEACAMAGRDAATLPSVFASIEGDMAVTDYLCRTLAANPLDLSPTRFHNSVHNAAAGYWSIASGCHAPSTAISASHMSFAAGLLESATQALCEQTPVLLVAYDTHSPGPLADVWPSASLFGAALIVAPADDTAGLAILRLRCDAHETTASALPQHLVPLAAANPMAASALPLLALLAGNTAGQVTLAGDGAPALTIEVER